MADEPRRPLKRQARGERRIAQILAAAVEVFDEVGYEAATTNAIAARARMSPGSLYQFFGNKDEIVRAVAARYATELAAAHEAALSDQSEAGELVMLPLDRLVDRALGPIERFNREHKGFKALFARTDLPPALTAATAPLHEALFERVRALLAARAPQVPDAEVRRVTTVSIQLVKALMPMIAAGGPDGPWYSDQLRTVLTAYLTAALADPDPAR